MISSQPPKTVTLAMTGASGAQYGLRLLSCLLESGVQVRLLISNAAKVVIKTETDFEVALKTEALEAHFKQQFSLAEGQLRVYNNQQWFSPPASGSNVSDAMVVCPCSMSSLSAFATGASNNLIERAADVSIKERKPLLLLVREMPFSAIHLENMLKLAQLGAVVMPASPGFYHQPQSIDDLVDFVVARLLDHLNIEQQLCTRWSDD